MAVYIALLRGINVGGHKKIRMAALQAVFDDLGYPARTYIQSGNVVFKAPRQAPARLSAAIARHLLRRFGFDIDVFVRQPAAFRAVIRDNPFRDRNDTGRQYVAFLEKAPAAALAGALQALAAPPEECVVAGNVVYLYLPAGAGNAKMNNSLFERKLAVAATTRNWNTVEALLAMAEAL
jgi:uncharacterized protein (DUF1697 family)